MCILRTVLINEEMRASYMSNILVLLIVAVLLVGCSKPIDTVLPKNTSRYWQAEMKQVMEKLQPEEQELLAKFMNRHVPTVESGGVAFPIADGTTIKQAIAEQKFFDAVETKQKAGAAALMEKIQKQEAEAVALNEALRQQTAEVLEIKESIRQQEAKDRYSANSTTQHEANVAVQDANAYNRIKQQAMLDYGVPDLEQQLQIAMQKDKQDPRWLEFQSDSPETAKIRSRLLAAKVAAEQSILLSTSSKKMLSPR